MFGFGERKTPLFIDLAFGRVGSYIRTETGSTSEKETIVYIPLGSLREVRIPDCPKGSLIIVPPFDSRCPQEGLAILVRGENGQAPLAEEHLAMHMTKMIETLRSLAEKQQMRISAAETAVRIAERQAEERWSRDIDKLKKLKEAASFYTKSEES
ncbi:MAG: hypothetical protein ACTSUF_09680 [Candidatus Heimdallarchaeaceae archaeon]